MEDPDRPGDHACPHTLVTSIPDGIHKHKHTHNVNRWIEANQAAETGKVRYMEVAGTDAQHPATYRRLFGPLADELEAVAGYIMDLDGAIDALAKMSSTPDTATRVMLWECAVIRYGRVFASGVRPRVEVSDGSQDGGAGGGPSVEVTDFPADLRKVHLEVMDLRNKHIAHSVNHMERAIALVSLADVSEGLAPEYFGAGAMTMRMIPVGAAAAEPFRRLIEEMRATFEAKKSELCAAVDRELDGVPLEEMYALPPLRFRSQEIPTARARKQFRPSPRH